MKPIIIDKETIYFKIPTFIVDAIALCGCLFITFRLNDDYFNSIVISESAHIPGILFFLLLAWSATIWLWDLKIANRSIRISTVLVRALGQSITVTLAFALLLALVYQVVPSEAFVYVWLLSWAILSINHIVVNLVATALRKYGRNKIRVVFVGNDHNIKTLMHDMQEGVGMINYLLDGVFTSKYAEEMPDIPVLGKMDDILGYLGDNNNHIVDEIYCSLNPSVAEQQEIIQKLVKYCNTHFIRFYFVPNMDGFPKRRMDFHKMGRVSVLRLHEEPLANPVNKFVKRAFDIIFSGLFLLLLYPWIWIFVSIGIKRSSPGPIYFRQARTGYNGKSFMMYKFRSMHVNTDADKVQATKDDPRKFKFGNFLRKTSIDELPQLINVFLGDMSIIGPRPHMEFHTQMYSELINDYMVRHLVKPGLSGWAQVNGCRGETETVQQMKDRVDHDIWYIENWSLLLDFDIIFKTIKQVVGGDKQAY